MARLLLHTIALEPHRWQAEKKPLFSLQELLAPIAGAGFHFVELWQNHFAHETFTTIRDITKKATDLGLSFPVAGCYPTLDLTGAARDNHMHQLEEYCDRALLLGSSLVKIFVGRNDRSAISDQEYRDSVESMVHLLRIAAARRMVVVGEIHENTLFSGVVQALKLVHDAGAPNFKICFQPLDFSDTAATRTAFEAVRDHVAHIHFQGRKAGVLCLLEDADIDYSALVEDLARGNYNGTMSIEFVKDCVVGDPADFDMKRVADNAARDREYLCGLGKEHGLEIIV